MYFGDIRLGETIEIPFTTVNTSGAPTQLSGSPEIVVYQRNSNVEITNGITLETDFDGVTGSNMVTIVANSTNGFNTANNYSAIISVGNVSSTSVIGYYIGNFSIENRSALRSTNANQTLNISTDNKAEIDQTFPNYFANLSISPLGEITLAEQSLNDIVLYVDTDSIYLANIYSRLPTLANGRVQSDVISIAGNTQAAVNLRKHALKVLPVTFNNNGTTSTANIATVNGASPSANANAYYGAVLIFETPALLKDKRVVISNYQNDGINAIATITTTNIAVDNTATAIMV